MGNPAMSSATPKAIWTRVHCEMRKAENPIPKTGMIEPPLIRNCGVRLLLRSTKTEALVETQRNNHGNQSSDDPNGERKGTKIPGAEGRSHIDICTYNRSDDEVGYVEECEFPLERWFMHFSVAFPKTSEGVIFFQ